MGNELRELKEIRETLQGIKQVLEQLAGSPSTQAEEKPLKAVEVAKVIGCSAAYISQLAARGEIPFVQGAGKTRRFYLSAVTKALGTSKESIAAAWLYNHQQFKR